MSMTTATLDTLVLPPDQAYLQRLLRRVGGPLLLILMTFVAIHAQGTAESVVGEKAPTVVEGVSDSMVYGLGRS
ncbi:MAG: hypothetical protein ABJB97_11705, partial [Acidobacteriota bacterium]